MIPSRHVWNHILLSVIGAGWLSGSALAVPTGGAWHDSLEQGLAEARQKSRPVLVVFGASWCHWCHKLEEELATETLHDELASWTLVGLDLDREREAGQRYAVSGIPALRILSPTGELLAQIEGYMPASELKTWLSDQRTQLDLASWKGLLSDAPLDTEAAGALIKSFDQREPVMREMAIAKLIANPTVSASLVVKAFVAGKLAVRLGALEILTAWNAPVAELDPWRPDTLTEVRLAALRDWATNRPEPDTKVPVQQTPANTTTAELQAMLDRYLAADVIAADAAREQIARMSPSALSLVVERLQSVSTDHERVRLTALRYRLAATSTRAANWSSGFARLASTNAAIRHRAIAELADSANEDDTKLLLELFSDADPLLRETSLRALRRVGGSKADDALLTLLNDPDPNVRAAVLKEFAESPSAGAVAQLAEYVATETDESLLGHAIRALAVPGSVKAADALIPLLKHQRWRVRAESAEALGRLANSSYGEKELDAADKARVYAALIQLLEDPDDFVVSRALQGLSNVSVIAAVDPLIKLALRRPEIAHEALQILASSDLRSVAEERLLDLLDDERSALRRAALSALTENDLTSVEDRLPALLTDDDASVRLLAIKSCYKALQGRRNFNAETRSSRSTRGGLLSLFSSKKKKSQPSRAMGAANWLAELYDGGHRPKWSADILEPLQVILDEEDIELRLWAALTCLALGEQPETARFVIEQALAEDPLLAPQAAEALSWTPESARPTLYANLLASGHEADELDSAVIQALAAQPDHTSLDLIWQYLNRDDISEAVVVGAQQNLREAYFGDRYYNTDQLDKDTLREIKEDLRSRAASGAELPRILALTLLALVDKKTTQTQAEALYDDPNTPLALRRDAFQIVLATTPEKRNELALAALAGDEPELKPIALMGLAEDESALSVIHDRLYITTTSISRGRQQEYSVEPPKGLTIELLEPLRAADNEMTRVYVSYLLALLGDDSSLDTLVAIWRDNHRADEQYRRMVYRAIAALGDDQRTPILEEVYESFGERSWYVSEFYWTIRPMKGTGVLKLRKRIRKEVGMESLR